MHAAEIVLTAVLLIAVVNSGGDIGCGPGHPGRAARARRCSDRILVSVHHLDLAATAPKRPGNWQVAELAVTGAYRWQPDMAGPAQRFHNACRKHLLCPPGP
jgi:hypothetical protein